MEMIKIWWSVVLPLQDAFMRNRTFYWAVMAIMGFCSRQDSLGGVTSWVRCTGVNPDKYTDRTEEVGLPAVNMMWCKKLWTHQFRVHPMLFLFLGGSKLRSRKHFKRLTSLKSWSWAYHPLLIKCL